MEKKNDDKLVMITSENDVDILQDETLRDGEGSGSASGSGSGDESIIIPVSVSGSGTSGQIALNNCITSCTMEITAHVNILFFPSSGNVTYTIKSISGSVKIASAQNTIKEKGDGGEEEEVTYYIDSALTTLSNLSGEVNKKIETGPICAYYHVHSSKDEFGHYDSVSVNGSFKVVTSPEMTVADVSVNA